MVLIHPDVAHHYTPNLVAARHRFCDPFTPTTVDLVLAVVAVFLPVAFPGDGDAQRGPRAAASFV